MGGEGGVISSSVLHVQYQSDVQNLCFQLGVRTVRTEDMENVFRCGKLRLRRVDVKTLPVMVMAVGLVGVHGQHGEEGDELQGLAQYVGQGNVVRPVIIGVERQDAAGQSIHHIFAGRFHNNIPHEMGGKRAVGGQESGKCFQLFFVRQIAE